MRIYRSKRSDGGHVKVVYLKIGGNKGTNSLGEECESTSLDRADLDLIVFDGKETVRDPMEFSALRDEIVGCDLLVVDIHGDVCDYKKYDALKKDIEKHRVNTYLTCAMPESMKEASSMFLGDAEEYIAITKYLSLDGRENRRNLLLYLVKLYGDPSLAVPEPKMERMQGVYHPGMPRDISLDDYMATLDPSKPTVGILIGQQSWLNGDLEPQDLIIGYVEKHGANALPVFLNIIQSDINGSIGLSGVMREYLTRDGRGLVDALILCGLGFSSLALANPGDGSREGFRNYFQELNVPVIASLAMFRSQEEWRNDGIGMDGGELCVSVALPELDGQLTSVPYVFTEKDENGIEYRSFIPDRLERIARMAVRWSKVHMVPTSERKVSMLFNASSLSNASIGLAGGLDALESVCRLLARMKQEGYTIDHVPRNSRELIDELLANITDNLDWDTEETIEERAADFLDTEEYTGWTEEEAPGYMEWVCRNWGQPPGEIMSHRGRFIIPGVLNGNVYIGFEPPRGKHEQAEALIHDPDLSTPHHYYAYYRWISRVFKTDVHLHIGTHGSCEWLPGKGNGLSRECFPDIMMEDLPHLYLYVIDDPSEGIVAKRRKKSILVDYLMPSLARAGTYDQLGDLEGHLQGYLYAKQTMQSSKMESEGEKICQLIGELSLWGELGIPEGTPSDQILSKCEVVFDYVTELKDGLMINGLHIAGDIPQEEKLDEMIYCLTRLKNGRIPSFRRSIAKNMGYDLDHLLDHMSEVDPSTGKLNGQLVDLIDDRMQECVTAIRQTGYDRGKALAMMEEEFGEDDDIASVTGYICEELYPNICGIEDEINNMIVGMAGGYVPPGPSGAPSRGNAHLLPTGKNYYSLDPETVPSEESWKAGQKMAEDMVRSYIEREGKYPESVGIVIWSIDTMKTGGDDVAYVLYLLGVRPVWGSVGGKITGLEVMSREELKRPRIDVTVRISSLFRDTFPNLFQLIDEAVELAANVEESDEDNYLRKHLKQDIARMIEEGLSAETAQDRAMVRVFGEPPGVYGAGVNTLIESRKWKDVGDLAEIYITFGCSAYGRKHRGEKMPETFRHRLVSLDVAVKNQVDREIDLVDIDDGYAFLGGINAVCRAAGREIPVNYLCDTSDPDRIKTRDLEHEIAYILRTRVLNPKWVESMKDHGFTGAAWVHEDINHVFGWDATSDVIEPWMYQSLIEHFLFDQDNYEWIAKENPYALKDILEDLLEAVDRDMWEPDDETLSRLRELYLEAEGMLEEMAADKRGERHGRPGDVRGRSEPGADRPAEEVPAGPR
ncbi:MAG: cobaltochelatase subunit CobN [Candidatus Methanomethylophilaceae archaeon]|nr:cobaltochelatase subunit CobN [Candidatus Methanomethylophilaceae archaeon]